MTAPVPYSTSTKFATQIGTGCFVNGLIAVRPVSNPSFSTSPVIRAVRSCARNRCALRRGTSPPGASPQACDERMLGREQDEVGAVDRVDAGGEDLDRVGARDSGLGTREFGSGLDVCRVPDPESRVPDRREREAHASALGSPDPVPLHRQDLLGPAGQLVGCLQQLVGVACDAEEPLLQLADRHRRAAAPAPPSTTCSLASTVLQLGHQLTLDRLRYARSRSSIFRKIHWFQR